MPVYTQSALSSAVALMVSGSFSAADFLTIANMAVREVLSEVDIVSTRRKSALSPNLFDEIYQYSCPSDLKDPIDIKPQIKRGRFDYWRYTTEEEFDRYKQEMRTDKWGDPISIKSTESWLGDNLIAISEKSLTKILLLSRPIEDEEVVISELDSTTSGGGTWAGFGDGTNLTKDTENYIKGSAALNWDISAVGGTTAGVYNSGLDSFDISKYLSEGAVFVWAYITSITYLTNFILRIGSSSSNYYYITVTTNNEGNAFEAGWNLLRFNYSSKATNGTPDDDACTYAALYMTKNALKISETDYRFDWLVMKKGDHYDVIYYSKYGWQSSVGTWLENATADTDYLNADIEEFNLIAEKTAELMEQKLKNFGQADRHQKRYNEKRAAYIFDHPSESLILSQKYFDLRI